MSRWRFGLDVGHGAVKILGLRTGESREARAALRKVEATSSDAATLRAAQVTAIRAAASEVGLARGAPVSVALPLADVVLKTEQVPDMPPAEVEGFARLRALSELPFDDRELLTTHALSARAAGGMRHLLFAFARKERVNSLLSLVREAGLEPRSLEPAGNVLCALLSRSADAGIQALLVDVGAERSSLVLLSRGELISARSVPLGAKLPGAALAASLAAEIQRSIRSARREVPPRVFLAGAGALDAELRQALQSALSAEVALLDGLAGLESLARSSLPGPLFAVSRGLAEEPGDRPMLDFLGEREAERAALLRRRRIALAASVLVLLGGIAGLGLRTLSAREKRIEELRASLAALEPQVDRASRVAAEIHAAGRWTDLKGHELEILGAFVAALPQRAYLTRFQWTEGQAVKVAGRAADADVVASYIRSLERSPLVASATFDQITRYGRSTGGEVEGVDFAITAHLKGEERRARR